MSERWKEIAFACVVLLLIITAIEWMTFLFKMWGCSR